MDKSYCLASRSSSPTQQSTAVQPVKTLSIGKRLATKISWKSKVMLGLLLFVLATKWYEQKQWMETYNNAVKYLRSMTASSSAMFCFGYL
jgi:hypothetical protein